MLSNILLQTWRQLWIFLGPQIAIASPPSPTFRKDFQSFLLYPGPCHSLHVTWANPSYIWWLLGTSPSYIIFELRASSFNKWSEFSLPSTLRYVYNAMCPISGVAVISQTIRHLWSLIRPKSPTHFFTLAMSSKFIWCSTSLYTVTVSLTYWSSSN